MNARAFIDTNLLIYSISTEEKKANAVEQLLLKPFDFVLSTQVINEFVHTCLRKNLLPLSDIRHIVEDLLLFFELVTIEEATIAIAFELKENHHFSWYDALILASALESDCALLFSEDMQHGMVIGNKMTIQNPFLI